jgi:hypothetical protein
LLAYATTNGREGVVERGDCKVLATAVPGNQVRVSSGGVVMRNWNAGGTNQSYIGRNVGDDLITVPAQGSGSGRSDLLVARVEDPQYSPWGAPPSVENGPYIYTRLISNVAGTTTSARQLGLTYPAIALARIDIPASTATITNAMIKDVRQLFWPQETRTIVAFEPATDQQLLAVAFSLWPSTQPTIVIPEWATWVEMQMTLTGILRTGTLRTVGQIRCVIAPGNPNTLVGTGVTYDTEAQSTNTRHSLSCGLSGNIQALAGQSVTIRGEGSRSQPISPNTADRLEARAAGTQVRFDIQFYERAV